MGLTEADGRTLKQPAKAYAEIQKWLLGARMTAYVHYAGGTWTCEITREGGHRAWIAWHPDKESEFALPREWKVKQIKELTGGTRDVTGILVVNLGPMPLLLESNSKCKMR